MKETTRNGRTYATTEEIRCICATITGMHGLGEHLAYVNLLHEGNTSVYRVHLVNISLEEISDIILQPCYFQMLKSQGNWIIYDYIKS